MKLITTIVLFWLSVATPAFAQTAEVTPQVSTTGVAHIRVAPNIGYVTFYVQKYDKEYRSASKFVERKVKKYTVGLKDQSLNIGIGTEMLTPSNPGYTVTRTIVLQIRDLKKLPDVVTYLADFSLNFRITYSHTDLDQLKRDVQKDAMKDARNKAFQLAEIAGSSVGHAKTISSSFASVTPPQAVFENGTPLEAEYQAGLITIGQSITATFGLRPKLKSQLRASK